MTSYRIFRDNTGTDIPGPVSSTSFSGGIVLGLGFKTTATTWLEGYWWWVASGQATSANFALWQTSSASPTGVGVANSQVTSGTLAAGWNYVPLAAPLPLTHDTAYRAAAGLVNNFPFTGGYFGTGGAGAAGLTGHSVTGAAGPLFAFSDQAASGGTAPDPWGNYQGAYSNGGSAAGTFYPNIASVPASFNGWVDVQVTDTPPAGASYSLWPSLPSPLSQGGAATPITGTTDGYTMSTQFSLSQPCTLDRIRFFSNTGATVLPSRCAVWDVNSQTVVSGTDNASPSWLKDSDGSPAAAAAGWVYVDYSSSGVTLAASAAYKAAVFSGAAAGQWRTATNPYWATPGDGVNGWASGPISAPNSASASVGQDSWHGPNLTWAYPGTFSNPENDWIDIQVTPASASPVQYMYSMRMMP